MKVEVEADTISEMLISIKTLTIYLPTAPINLGSISVTKFQDETDGT